ncbi:hypothetical protein EJB05_01602, partial [Eragrostis curvula]
MKGKRHECNKLIGSGRAVWLLLPLVLYVVLKTGFVVLKSDLMLQDAHCFHSARRQQQVPLGVSKSEASKGVAPPPAETSKLTCNFSDIHSNFCEMQGDVRIHGKYGMVYVVSSPSSTTYRPDKNNSNSVIRIRPYTRKWEEGTMSRIRELAIRELDAGGGGGDPLPPPRCTVRHAGVPAVVFSVGGCGTNFFHAMSDVVIPLYVTAREYGGHVQLVVADHDARWFAKYRRIVAALSFYPVVDMDGDDVVRCFPAARVGLESHGMLGIDPARARNGLTMVGFREFLRSVFSLPRPLSTPVSRRRSSGGKQQQQQIRKRPRLVMLLRRNWRSLTNEADVIAALAELGFEVVAATPKDMSDLARFANVVNSCDVLVGVHGAGLTNMVFLPHNGTIVQIIPWGELKWASRYDYGDPVPDMGLRYVEYEVTAEETTLKDKYPRDHPVFADPLSIHRKGEIFKYFLGGQNVTLDIPRFINETMRPLYESITTE